MQRLLSTLLACIAAAGAVHLEFVNNAMQTLWVGSQGVVGKINPDGGGWVMSSGSTRGLDVPDDWAGRFWARTDCNPNGSNCRTGDCGQGTKCAGAGPSPPVTRAEFLLNGFGGNDYYYVNLIQGYNVPITINTLCLNTTSLNEVLNYRCYKINFGLSIV